MIKIGSVLNPIALDEDETEQLDLETKLEIARNKEIIQQAKMTRSPLDICFAAIKTSIPGDFSLKEHTLNKAIIKYYKESININISCEHFYPKNDPDYTNPEVQPNPCEIILYGVDFLTTNAIKDRFKVLNTIIREINWINDSCCKLKYATAEEAEKVLKDQTKQIKIEQDADSVSKGWYLLKPYFVYSFERRLYVRYATNQQQQIDKQLERKYQLFQQAQVSLANHLLEKFAAKEKYKEVVAQIEQEQLSRKRRNDRRVNRSRDNPTRSRRVRNDSEEINGRIGQGSYYNRMNGNNQRRLYNESRVNTSFQKGFNKNNGNYRGPNRYQPETEEVTQIRKERYEHRVEGYQAPNNRLNNQKSNVQKKVYYDSFGDVESDYSFNVFGMSVRSKDKDNLENLDFDFKRSDYDHRQELASIKDLDFSYNDKKNDNSSNPIIDTSFHLDKCKNKEDLDRSNLSYGFKVGKSGKKESDNAEQEYFDFKSAISSVRQANEPEINTSFNIPKEIRSGGNKKQNKGKGSNILQNMQNDSLSY